MRQQRGVTEQKLGVSRSQEHVEKTGARKRTFSVEAETKDTDARE